MTGLIVESVTRPHLPGPVSFTAEAGKITALCGPNGAGKTTLLRALAGLTSGAGSVMLGGTDLSDMSRRTRAERIAWLPADRRADWPLRCRDVVALGLQTLDEMRVVSTMVRTETLEFADRRIDTLSTGERTRVLLARALVGRPDLLLLDEPAANLDPGHVLDILALLRAEAKRGAAVLMSVHDLRLARTVADSALLLDKGRVVASGSPADALSAERVARVFGVRDQGQRWVRA